jgi:GNAT superfamily N-acetyltransferase
MTVRIVEETAASLEEYGKVPIAFRVTSVFRVPSGYPNGSGDTLTAEPVEPYVKDYDAFEGERPVDWPRKFDLGNWGFLAAYDGAERVGGAVVAWNSRGVDMLEGRDDLACLWDIRVSPGYRGRGIGEMLFKHAAQWAKERGCTRLKIETQNVNVPACSFYAKQGCVLRQTNKDAYPPEINEIQLLWYLDL